MMRIEAMFMTGKKVSIPVYEIVYFWQRESNAAYCDVMLMGEIHLQLGVSYDAFAKLYDECFQP